jgi:hypothetical protein
MDLTRKSRQFLFILLGHNRFYNQNGLLEGFERIERKVSKRDASLK